jgi:RNA polymerase sigma-70 factor (ECF subfamily)
LRSAAEECLPPSIKPASTPLGLAEAPGASAHADDATLMELALRGERAAFHRLYFRHAPAVRRFLGNLHRDAAAAEEGTQETFARAFERLGRLKDPSRLRAWLMGIARIIALDELARRRREQPVAAAPCAEHHVDTPEARLLATEADRALDAALRGLPDERRAALLMRLDLQLSYEEIAEAMGWPLHKVKNEVHRARQSIKGAVLGYLEAAS